MCESKQNVRKKRVPDVHPPVENESNTRLRILQQGDRRHTSHLGIFFFWERRCPGTQTKGSPCPAERGGAVGRGLAGQDEAVGEEDGVVEEGLGEHRGRTTASGGP